MVEAIFGLVGVVVGSGLVLLYNLYRDRREREEKYRVMLYEKRLEAHQKAFCYIQKLNVALNTAQNDEDLWEVTREAREWWDSNCLYLDEYSRKDLLVAAHCQHFLGVC